MSDTMLAIYTDGIAGSAVVIEDADFYRKAIAEWSARPDLRELVRVPVEVARHFLLRPWPGLEAALAEVAKAAESESQS